MFVGFLMQAFAHKMLVTEAKALLPNPNFLDSTDVFSMLSILHFGKYTENSVLWNYLEGSPGTPTPVGRG